MRLDVAAHTNGFDALETHTQLDADVRKPHLRDESPRLEPVDKRENDAAKLVKIIADQRGVSHNSNKTGAVLNIALAIGPIRRILRPVEIETQALADTMLQTALFGENQIFDRSLGNELSLVCRALTVPQERRLDDHGSLLLRLPINDNSRRRSAIDLGGILVLVEGVIHAKLFTTIGFAAAAIEHIVSA